MPDPSYLPKIYRRQGGDEMVVANGGRIIPELTPAVVTTVGNETYSAAQLAGGIIERDPNGSARTDTTDTAANLIATLKLQGNGETAECQLINTADAAETITLAGGTGVTLKNALQTIAQNECATLLFRRTAATTVDLYILGA